jgi:hypothetical protein
VTFNPPSFAAAVALVLTACASSVPPSAAPGDEPIPAEWLQLGESPRYPALSYDAGGVLLHVPRTAASAGVRVVQVGGGSKLVKDDKELTPSFLAIDSFDVSLERREIVFSAKRTDNFDVGLVSLDGSDIHWIPEDPADEVGVQWAPRGNKVSYVVRSRGGDLVRTVHIPTSMQLTTEFPFGRVHALAWDPRAERYAVSWSSVDAADRIEVMAYAGNERNLSVAPAVKLPVEVEPIGGALMLHPAGVRYNEKIPLVVWRTGDRNEWSDARGALERDVTVACAVIDRDPDDAFWAAVASIPWIDSGHAYVIGVKMVAPAGVRVSQEAAAPAGATWVVPDASVPAGRYRKRDNIVSVAPALVQSFGAAWVAHQLKGHPPANGSHR